MTMMNEDAQKKVKELVEEVKTCMFTTTNELCQVHSRPMLTVRVDNECHLWFFSQEYGESITENNSPREATLVYAHPGKNTYMNVHGSCEIIRDKNKMKELWIPALTAWFPEGVDSPAACLLKITVDAAAYWDNARHSMVEISSINSQLHQQAA